MLSSESWFVDWFGVQEPMVGVVVDWPRRIGRRYLIHGRSRQLFLDYRNQDVRSVMRH